MKRRLTRIRDKTQDQVYKHIIYTHTYIYIFKKKYTSIQIHHNTLQRRPAKGDDGPRCQQFTDITKITPRTISVIRLNITYLMPSFRIRSLNRQRGGKGATLKTELVAVPAMMLNDHRRCYGHGCYINYFIRPQYLNYLWQASAKQRRSKKPPAVYLREAMKSKQKQGIKFLLTFLICSSLSQSSHHKITVLCIRAFHERNNVLYYLHKFNFQRKRNLSQHCKPQINY